MSSSKQINDRTYLFKISGCTTKDYQIIDSIVKADAAKIKSATNLIVDISNNLGSSSSVVWPIFPFIFTNPIAKHVTSFYSTEDNIQEWINSIEEYKLRPNYDTQYVKYMNEWIAYWQENSNIFTTNHADTFRYDSIYAKPKNVGLIINYACQSASELIILMFKQSKKVTVFGERTMGAIDYLDFYPLNTPSKKYSLYVASTKRVIPPGGKKYDGVGIYPDVTIPDYVADWQQFVVDNYRFH